MSSQDHIKAFILKCLGFFFKTSLLLAAALMIGAMPAGVAEEVLSGVEMAPCKGLKPVNNIEDLLYQFYINLDDDCLFKMSASELEKIWGLKISLRAGLKQDNFDPNNFFLKPYESEKDAFYVEQFQNRNGMSSFRIHITKAYQEKHATLFPNGNYPVLLPTPIVIYSWRMASHYPITSEPPQIQGEYRLNDFDYFWLNSDNTRMLRLTGFYGVSGMEVDNSVPEGYIGGSSYRRRQ